MTQAALDALHSLLISETLLCLPDKCKFGSMPIPWTLASLYVLSLPKYKVDTSKPLDLAKSLSNFDSSIVKRKIII